MGGARRGEKFAYRDYTCAYCGQSIPAGTKFVLTGGSSRGSGEGKTPHQGYHLHCYQSYMIDIAPKRYRCKDCDETFPSGEKTRKHLHDVHGIMFTGLRAKFLNNIIEEI